MLEHVDREAKTRTLRGAAAEFRRIAEAGEEAQVSIMAARMLEQRADRIEAGEDDHSAIRWDVPVGTLEPRAG